MATPTEIVRRLPTERFVAIITASPKAFREDLFRKSNVKVKGNAFSLAAANKNVVRAERLHQAIVEGLDIGDNVLEELIRNYLYTRRDLLAAALDQLGVTHDHGLTDQDLDFITTLEAAKATALREALEQRFDRTDVGLYLDFMRVPS
jgi:hypothetical protein